MSATAILTAAGSGERLGASVPKAFVELGGKPMLVWSLDALRAASTIDRILVTLPPGPDPLTLPGTESAPGNVRGSDPLMVCSHLVEAVQGGASRSESVRNAVERVDTELVVVHDAARPLVRAELFDEVVAALEADPDLAGVVAAAPVTDTTKEVLRGRQVERTIDRSKLWAAQTPQAFRTEVLRDALASTELLAQASDDAMLVERSGGRVDVHATSRHNVKVTTAADLRLAELLLLD